MATASQLQSAHVQVQVTAFAEHQGTRKDNIDATIFVEQESQKGIVIGRGGSALKALGTAARAEIEHFLGAPACRYNLLMQVLLPAPLALDMVHAALADLLCASDSLCVLQADLYI